MKTITFNSSYAAFAYRMTAEVGEDLTEATTQLALQGVANICYRTVGSNVDKALGVKSKKNGGMGREAVTFDPKHIPTIEAAVSAKITEMEADSATPWVKALKLSYAVTGEYVKGEGAKASAEAESLWTQVQALPEDKFPGAMAKLGLDVNDYDDARGIAACQRHIQAEKRAAAERAKNALGL